MLYAALKKCLGQSHSAHECNSDVEDVATDISITDILATEDVAATGSQNEPGMIINEEEAHMAVYLTEYFQEQRIVYEQVISSISLLILPYNYYYVGYFDIFF